MKNINYRSKFHEKLPFFAIILPRMASYGSKRSFLFIFSARDNLVKVSWNSDAWKCQNQVTLLTLARRVRGADQPLWEIFVLVIGVRKGEWFFLSKSQVFNFEVNIPAGWSVKFSFPPLKFARCIQTFLPTTPSPQAPSPQLSTKMSKIEKLKLQIYA